MGGLCESQVQAADAALKLATGLIAIGIVLDLRCHTIPANDVSYECTHGLQRCARCAYFFISRKNTSPSLPLFFLVSKSDSTCSTVA